MSSEISNLIIRDQAEQAVEYAEVWHYSRFGYVLLSVGISCLPGVVIPVFHTDNPLPWFFLFAGSIIVGIWSIISGSYALSDWIRTKKKAGCVSPGMILPVIEEIEHFNTVIEKLNRFAAAKAQLGLADSPEILALLRKKLQKLEKSREEILQKLEIINRLWGIEENEFDDLADVLFEGDAHANLSVKEMLEDSYRSLSARVEIEEDLIGIEPIEKARRKKRN